VVWRLPLLGLLVLACHAPEEGGATEPVRLDASLQPIFNQLKAAVDEDADDVARAILARLRPRCRDPLSVDMAEGYERILYGRSVRDAVKAQVVVQEVEGGFAVGLELHQFGFQRLSLTPGHARIEWTARSMDAAGRQSIQVGGRVMELPGTWDLSAGEVVEAPLGVDSPKFGEGLLAVRCEWRVTLGAGSSVVAKERYPAQGMRVSDGAIVRLAKELPTGAVLPAELIRYATGPEVRREALLERAVRIPPGLYEDTLDLLGEREREFSPSRLQDLVPCLVWLTGTSGIEATGEEWRKWLNERLKRREGGGNLDLPDGASR